MIRGLVNFFRFSVETMIFSGKTGLSLFLSIKNGSCNNRKYKEIIQVMPCNNKHDDNRREKVYPRKLWVCILLENIYWDNLFLP